MNQHNKLCGLEIFIVNVNCSLFSTFQLYLLIKIFKRKTLWFCGPQKFLQIIHLTCQLYSVSLLDTVYRKGAYCWRAIYQTQKSNDTSIDTVSKEISRCPLVKNLIVLREKGQQCERHFKSNPNISLWQYKSIFLKQSLDRFTLG